jgi:hypothetical protein
MEVNKLPLLLAVGSTCYGFKCFYIFSHLLVKDAALVSVKLITIHFLTHRRVLLVFHNGSQ